MSLLPFRRRVSPPPAPNLPPPLVPVTDGQVARAVNWICGVDPADRAQFASKLLSDATTRWHSQLDGDCGIKAQAEYSALLTAWALLDQRSKKAQAA